MQRDVGRLTCLHSDPDIVDRGSFAALMPSVQHPSRFDQEEFDLVLCAGLVLDAFRNYEHLSSRDMHGPIAEINSQFALYHNECLIGVFVIVPNEVTLQLDDFKLIIVHFSDDLRLPLVAEQSELLLKVDWLIAHSAHLLLYEICVEAVVVAGQLTNQVNSATNRATG
jgi:hypothetical protein